MTTKKDTINSPSSTPLDLLKQTVVRADNLAGMALDSLTQLTTDGGPNFEREIDLIESQRRELWTALSQAVDGITWDAEVAMPRLTPAAWEAISTFDDGSPVCRIIDLAPGRYAVHYPRLDGDAAAFVRVLLEKR